MLATRKTVRHARRRALSVRPLRRVYVGSAVTRRASSGVFLARTTQQVTSRTRLGDWLGLERLYFKLEMGNPSGSNS